MAIVSLCASLQSAAITCAPEDSPDIVAQVVRHELDAAHTQGRWMYTATYTKDSVQYVARRIETDDGILTWVILRNGAALSDGENSSQRSTLNDLISSPDRLDRNRKAMRDDAVRINTLLADLPNSVQFDCLARSGDTASIHFEPKPGYSPWNLEERVIAGMSGALELNLKEMRLISADGTMQNDLSLFLGMGRIYKGSSVLLTRAKTMTGVWETTGIATHIDGQVLFLKTIAQHTDETRAHYCSVPSALKARDALPYLENPNCPPIQ